MGHLLLAACLALGCAKKPTEPQPSPIAPHPRYWMRDCPLLDAPSGKPIRTIDGPVLVEMPERGHVRTLSPGPHGYLPETFLSQPQPSGGLLLFAQRTEPIHLQSPTGPVIGYVHPGALVTVGVSTDPAVAISGFGNPSDKLVGYVARDALGPEPTLLQPPKRTGKGRSMLLPIQFWLPSPTSPHALPVSAAPCHPIWVPREGQPSQYLAGVELTGPTEYSDTGYHGARSHVSLQICLGHAVTRHGKRLFLSRPAPYPEMEIDAIPDAYAEPQTPNPDPIADMIYRGGSIYWMIGDPSNPRCEEWLLKKGNGKPGADGILIARLEGTTKIKNVDDMDETPWYPVEYSPGYGSVVSILKLDWMRPNLWRCYCTYEYRLLGFDGTTLIMTGYHMPEGFIAYDPSEVEHWFLTLPDCQAGLLAAKAAIERDPTANLRVGFHATLP